MNWKPSLKTGIEVPKKDLKAGGLKKIRFNPKQEQVHFERQHFAPRHESMKG